MSNEHVRLCLDAIRQKWHCQATLVGSTHCPVTPSHQGFVFVFDLSQPNACWNAKRAFVWFGREFDSNWGHRIAQGEPHYVVVLDTEVPCAEATPILAVWAWLTKTIVEHTESDFIRCRHSKSELHNAPVVFGEKEGRFLVVEAGDSRLSIRIAYETIREIDGKRDVTFESLAITQAQADTIERMPDSGGFHVRL